MQIGKQEYPYTTVAPVSDADVLASSNTINAKLDTSTEGSQTKLRTTNVEIEGLLTKILTELRIMNFHLSKVSGEEIMSSDIDN